MKSCNWRDKQGGLGGGFCPPSLYVKRGPVSSCFSKYSGVDIASKTISSTGNILAVAEKASSRICPIPQYILPS